MSDVPERKNRSYRLMVYNIRYATGIGWDFHFPFPWSGYLRKTHKKFRAISDFIKSCNPDIVGLLEVDGGSIRSPKKNQVYALAEEMDYFSVFQEKYSQTLFSRNCPIVRKQGNAFLVRHKMIGERCHYFRAGMKRLVIEIEMDDFFILLVHLSIRPLHRAQQLQTLSELLKTIKKPVIVAGDFNVFKGSHELAFLYKETRLRNANTRGLMTFPSTKPKWEIDMILCSPEIHIKDFCVPPVLFSDHLPLVCDFWVV